MFLVANVIGLETEVNKQHGEDLYVYITQLRYTGSCLDLVLTHVTASTAGHALPRTWEHGISYIYVNVANTA